MTAEEQTVTEAPAEAVVETPAEAAGLPSGAPYRALPDLGLPLVLSTHRRCWPVVGPALTTYALLLWSYVVMGQFTTTLSASTPLGEGKAFFVVCAVAGATWIVAIRRSRVVAPVSGGRLVTRSVGIAALAGLLFFVTVFLATLMGLLSRGLDMGIPFGLVLLSAGAVFYGRRLLVPDSPPRTQQERSVLLGLWMIAVLVTFIAGVDLSLNG